MLIDPAIWNLYKERPHDVRPVQRDLIAALDYLGIPSHILTRDDSPVDIWIRDWGFVEGCYFRYEPSYARNLYSAATVRKGREVLNQRTGLSPRSSPVVLDGGNLIHNGKVAILTEKVLTDNPGFSQLEIEATIASLGFERVIFIPVEPDDEVGHADGILRFISPNILLVNDYDDPAFFSYRRRLLKCLKTARLGAEIVPFPWFTRNEKVDGIWSAEGTYVNFILTRHGIVYPRFDHENDDRADDLLSQVTTLPRMGVFATPLARLGGVLNCIVLTY